MAGIECRSPLWCRPAVVTAQRQGQKPPLLAAFSKKAVKTTVFDKGPDCVGVLGEKHEAEGELEWVSEC